jgi:hypothetical protein
MEFWEICCEVIGIGSGWFPKSCVVISDVGYYPIVICNSSDF